MDHDQGDGMDGVADSTDEAGADDRRGTFLRRAVLRAGWTIPVVIALDAVPAFAAGSAPPHTDTPATSHGDVAHIDDPGTHGDVLTGPPVPLHLDGAPIHADSPHSDTPAQPHVDA